MKLRPFFAPYVHEPAKERDVEGLIRDVAALCARELL
jgi:hypothetical protein